MSYQEARKRLLEKSRSRGFWPSRGFKGGKKGKGKGVKGKSKGLAHRIANSTCRICGQTGHWKAECPSSKADRDRIRSSTDPHLLRGRTRCLSQRHPGRNSRNSEMPVSEECFTVVEPSFVRFRNRLCDKLQKQFGLRKTPRQP